MKTRIVDGPEGLTFLVPPRRQMFVVLFLPIWMVGWVFGEAFAVRTLRSGEAPTLFMGIWLAGWTFAGASAALTLLWMLAGRERIVLSGQFLEHRRELFGLGRGRKYELSQIRNLQVSPEPSDGSRNRDGLRAIGLAGGVVAFDYGARTIRFGAGIDEAEGRMIAKRILDRHRIRSADE